MAESGWDEAHGCWTAGRNGNARHKGDPLTVEQIRILKPGTVVVVTWSGGNGPWEYKIEWDEHRAVWAATAEGRVSRLIRYDNQATPNHRVTLR